MKTDNLENNSGAVQANISPNEVSVLKFLFANRDAWIVEDQIRIEGLSVREIASSVSWLESKRLIDVNRNEISNFQLTDEGRRFLQEGLPEERAYHLISSRKQLTVSDLMKDLGENDGRIALAQLAKLGIKPRNGVVSLEGAPLLDDEFARRRSFLNSLAAGSAELPADMINHFRKRENVIQEHRRIIRSLRINENGIRALSSSLSNGNLLGELTPEVIASGQWKSVGFQPYDLNSRVERVLAAVCIQLHTYQEWLRKFSLNLVSAKCPGIT